MICYPNGDDASLKSWAMIHIHFANVCTLKAYQRSYESVHASERSNSFKDVSLADL
jgi:hypothetical protein